MQWHEILGVPANASKDEVKAAYRKKALEFHPDRCKLPDAAERFIEVNNAYQALLDPTHKPFKPKSTPAPSKPRPRSNGSIYDAPPPKVDLWGKPFGSEERNTFVDTAQYYNAEPVFLPRTPWKKHKEPEIDLWKQTETAAAKFNREYWQEYARLNHATAYEEPEVFWQKLDDWVKAHT